MNFPATEYELVAPDYPNPSGEDRTTPVFTEDLGVRLVRSATKKNLPRGCALIPARVHIGAFRWRWWGLRDDYGKFLAQRIKPA